MISFDPFASRRTEFLKRMAATWIGPAANRDISVVLVTHLLFDRPALIEALSQHCSIRGIVAIPYSSNPRVVDWASQRHPVLQPSLAELIDGSCITELLCKDVGNSDLVLMEIGGYCATRLNNVFERVGKTLVGVIEGTESGLNQYRTLSRLPVPIIGMPLSPTKAAESAMVGSACLHSLDNLLRSAGFTNEIRNVAVLGYGRVGASVAVACRSRGLDVFVHDTDPNRRIKAIADGFLAPSRESCLRKAGLVLGAAGQRSWLATDTRHVRDGTIFASCSSKDLEFDVARLRRTYSEVHASPDITTLRVQGKSLHFLYGGHPINFRDGANLGPILTLLQAEMIACLGTLVAGRHPPGVQAPLEEVQRRVANDWIEKYIDPGGGWYRPRTVE